MLVGVGMHSALFGLKRGYYGALRWARRVLAGFGLTPARFDLMFVVAENGWHLQSELRRILGVAGATVSRMLKSLEELGLVERERAVHDEREKVVFLSEKGREAVERAAMATMASGCAEVAMARAAFGEARKEGWTFRRGMAAVMNLEEALVKVRRGFGDGAQLVYAYCPYAHRWVPKRTRELQLTYAIGLADPDPPDRTPVEMPEWPGPDIPSERPTVPEPIPWGWGPSP